MNQPSLGAYLAELEQTAIDANLAEERFRSEAVARIKELEHARAFAFRRLNLVRALASSMRDAKDEEEAITAGTTRFMQEASYSAASEARREVIDRFRPVVAAIWQAKQREERPEGEEPADEAPAGAAPDVEAELTKFEQWYAEHRNAPFLSLMEREPLELPLVEI